MTPSMEFEPDKHRGEDEDYLLPGGFDAEVVTPIAAEDEVLYEVWGKDGRPFVDRGTHPGGRRLDDSEIGKGAVIKANADVARIYEEIAESRKAALLSSEPAHDEPELVPYVGFDLPVRSPQVTVTKEKEPKFKVRPATVEDIPRIVDVDMQAFDSVYSNYPEDSGQLRAELIDKFTGRFEKVGGQWMPVLERNSEIVGFMTCCPTSKKPEDFKSWEDTTDYGTLETTYDPKGNYVYVVTLSVLPIGTAAKDRLFADQMGQMFKAGYKTAFFESRMPGLKVWAEKRARFFGQALEHLEPHELDKYADTYFNLKKQVNGKDVPLDRLLRLYDRVGCKLLKVVPNAYQDEPSLDYGVVCTYDGSEFFDGSVLPVKLPDNRFTRKTLSAALKTVSKSQLLTTKLLG